MSVDQAGSAAAGSMMDSVRAWQHVFYRAAKVDSPTTVSCAARQGLSRRRLVACVGCGAAGVHPEAGSKERRPLAIAAVQDRIVQAAVKIVLEPVFEADFLPCSFGFCPKRSAHDALQVLIDES
ncbi:hypothetical protein ACWDKQ_34980 [Saccharopolyspora sp. NPDC000995]